MNKIPLIFTVCSVLFLTACGGPGRGTIDDATILNWENEMVTMEQFVRDHKQCLGINRPAHQPQSRMMRMIQPNATSQMPDWGGLWVTFQSNEHRDVGQRMLMSVPANTTSASIGQYRQCMFRRGYLLRAM